jgi:hypothetical protein
MRKHFFIYRLLEEEGEVNSTDFPRVQYKHSSHPLYIALHLESQQIYSRIRSIEFSSHSFVKE